jgi:hypothetical protein
MSPNLVEELRAFRRRVGALGGYVFSAKQDANAPMDRHLFDKWLVHAERRAELPKLRGGAWHPYRRKWATERKHLPITDVAAAGGWTDVQTLLDCYQQPTNDALLAVMSDARKVRDTTNSRVQFVRTVTSVFVAATISPPSAILVR